MNGETVRVSINRSHIGKQPGGMTPEESRAFFKKYNGRFRNEQVTITQFIQAIQSGYAFSTWVKNYRKRQNFILGEVVALDMDTKDERSSFDYLAQDPFICRNASFLYTTPSHRPDAPKCRVVFVLDKAICNPDKYTLLAESLLFKYGAADKRCKDPARIFYGSLNCAVMKLDGGLSLETAARVLVEPFNRHQEHLRRAAEEKARHMQVVDKDEIPKEVIKSKVDRLLSKVKVAPDGDKYGTLRDIGRVMGGGR